MTAVAGRRGGGPGCGADTLLGAPDPAEAPPRSAVLPSGSTSASAALSWERALGALFAGLVALAASRPISDNSLLTHIATGRLQVSGGLPGVNPFLVSTEDFPVPSWWWSAALGWSERLAGLGAVRLFTVVMGALLGWLVLRCSRPVGHPCEPGRNPMAQALPAAMVLAILIPWINGRPQLGGFVLLAAALLVWRERRSPWWMVAVFAIWVNVHGTWLYGALLVALLCSAEMLDARSLRTARKWWLVAVGGGVLLGGAFYPERFRLVLLPTEQLGSPEARSAIGAYREWSAPGLSSPWVWLFAMVAGLALYGVLRRPGNPGFRIGSAAAVVLLALMGLSALRLLPVAAITLAAFAGEGIARISRMEVPPVPVSRFAGAMSLLVVLGAASMAWHGPHVELSRYPVAEVDWLAERNLVADAGTRVIANDWVGNYLEFRFGEEANAWVDDRPSAATMIDYVRLRGLAPGWREAFDRADPDVVLWQAEDPLPDEIARSPEWIPALTTDRFRVLCHARIESRCR